MSLSSVALFDAVKEDVTGYLPFGPVALGDIPPDASYKQFASARLLECLLKKWVPQNTELPDDVAKKKFLASNKKCEDWSLRCLMESDRQLFGLFLREVDDFLHPEGQLLFSSYYDILAEARTGPGSAIGARGQSFYAKLFSSPITTTSPMLWLYYNDYIEWYDRYSEAEAIRRSTFRSARIVNGSRSSFVPKTSAESRMICVEPSLNIFFQLGLGTILERRLYDTFGIRMDAQPQINRRLARQGSIDGSFATIDLSSASDSISLNLCKASLPSWFFETLMELRSPETNFGNESVPLHMMSTMGNGFTFPFQTFMFSCMIRAALRNQGLTPGPSGSNWACFGDDLIIDTRSYRDLDRLLSMLGFTINRSKSFFEGPFRESCGADWFHGQPVRGVYIKTLRSPQDITVAINLLNQWSAYAGISLRKGVSYLVNGLRTSERRYVPFFENQDSGIRVPLAIMYPDYPKHDANKSYLYRAYRAKPKKVRVCEGVIRTPRGCKRLIFNPQGLEISFLFGELVSYTYFIRHDIVRYRTKLCVAPSWDYMPVGSSINGFELSWQQWETAVLINLSNP